MVSTAVQASHPNSNSNTIVPIPAMSSTLERPHTTATLLDHFSGHRWPGLQRLVLCTSGAVKSIEKHHLCLQDPYAPVYLISLSLYLRKTQWKVPGNHSNQMGHRLHVVD
jgi:hypothetical protein